MGPTENAYSESRGRRRVVFAVVETSGDVIPLGE
jgi:hypothetical protein